MDFKKEADDVMSFIKRFEAKGCRFPGSAEEKAACEDIQAEIKGIGLSPKTEDFVYAPNASIGGIYRLGWAGLLFMTLYYLSFGTSILAMVGYVGIIVFIVLQIITYSGALDYFFKHEKSSNIITELPPASGKADYTIILGAHYDSSWCWKLSAKNPKTMALKTAWGIVGAFAMLILSILKVCYGFGAFDFATLKADNAMYICLMVLPIIFIPGFIFITQYSSNDKSIGSPGAMDNLSGIGINMRLMQYYKENPDALPANCKLINVCFAAEEASLKGSMDYAKRHKDEFENCYFINVDSIADADHFEAVKGDTWLMSHFDKELINMTLESMKEVGIDNPAVIANPVGGCDATPMTRAGVPSVTVAAQDPRPTAYYHTYMDVSDRFPVTSLQTGLIVIDKLVKKICDKCDR